jgi:hypothetical protein
LSGVVRLLICHYHGIDYQHVPIAVERRHVRLAVETLTAARWFNRSSVVELIKKLAVAD